IPPRPREAVPRHARERHDDHDTARARRRDRACAARRVAARGRGHSRPKSLDPRSPACARGDRAVTARRHVRPAAKRADTRRGLPSVDAVLRAAAPVDGERERLTRAARDVLAKARSNGVRADAAGFAAMARASVAGRKEVVVARGGLVEIGGGFRIPDVLRRSGAKLVEVGTTNRTYARDYAGAISERTAAILRVHASNFKLTGFVARPEGRELAALARERGIVFIHDLGS